MTTMLDKAARAACEADGGDWDSIDYHHAVGEAVRQEYRDQARAVLMAVREPDASVAEAGDCNGDHTLEGMGPNYPSAEESCASIFTAMIDAILSEPQP